MTVENWEAPQTAKQLFLRNAIDNGDFISYIDFEKRHGRLNEAINLAIEQRPEDDDLMISIASIFDDIDDLRKIEKKIKFLEETQKRIPNSEMVAIELIKSFIEAKMPDEAYNFIEQVISEEPFSSSLQIHLYLALINEQKVPFDESSYDFLNECIKKFPNYFQFYILLADHSEDSQNVLKAGIDNCPSSGDIHIAYIRQILSMKLLPSVRIRALFEKARRLCSDQALVWLLSAEFERPEMRETMLEEAKRHVCKEELGIVWSRQIELSVDQEGRLTLCRDALEEVKAPELYLMNAICLWRKGLIDKTRTAFENIEREFPTFGDGWVYRILFEYGCGSPEDRKNAKDRAAKCKIEDGMVWRFTKLQKDKFLCSQDEILEDLVYGKADPMSSEDSIYNEVLSVIDDLM